MTTQIHALLGLLVLVTSLVVGIWAFRAARRGQTPPRLAGAMMAAVGLLLVQVLMGFDLWARGARPAESPLAEVHIAGPIIALLVGVALVFFRRGAGTAAGAGTAGAAVGGEGGAAATRWAAASLVIFLVALVSYAIGEMGNVRG
jgi:hypothetical protein